MLFLVKFIHSAIFVVLSGCILYMLYSGISGDITAWTGFAMVLVVVEIMVYTLNSFRCPLTKLAQTYGDVQGDDFIADIFLPAWFVPLIVPLCTVLAVTGFVLVGVNLWRMGTTG